MSYDNKSQYEQLLKTTPTTTIRPVIPINEFNVGDTVILYEDVPGYRSSNVLISNQTVKAGTYTIYQLASGKRHPVNLSSSDSMPGTWVDTSKLYKQPSGFFVGDSVYVSETTNGFDSSTSSESTSMIAPGYYTVDQTDDGAKHPVYISSDTQTPGAWVDSTRLKLQTKPPLYQEGDVVTLTESTPAYKTSIATKPTSFIPKGTYYVYQYIEKAPHPLNISSETGMGEVWVNLNNIKKK